MLKNMEEIMTTNSRQIATIAVSSYTWFAQPAFLAYEEAATRDRQTNMTELQLQLEEKRWQK